MKMKILAALSIFALSSSLFADNWVVAEAILKKHRLDPYMTSQFAQEHPGIIPVTRCALTSAYGGLQSPDGRFIYSDADREQKVVILCYAKKSRVGVLIPANAVRDRAVGLALAAFTDENVPKLSGLDRVRVNQIFGTYKGIQGGIGFLANAGGSALFKDGIVMTITESPIAVFSLNVSYRKIKVEPRQAPLEAEWYSNPWSLHYQNEAKASVDWALYNSFQFVQDDDKVAAKTRTLASQK
ncbi:MAG: hypothetical protein HYW48_11645 [Deltaproteobacteria bacterium]|nr:hypothetical protein [Deltaproteobacteria bacterium]